MKICEQTNQEPDPERMPPEIEDFPLDVQKALVTFNKLGDRIYPDVGYLGKDYCSLDIHMRLQTIENEDIFVETLLRLDEKVIKKSQAELKAHYEEMKRKAR